MDRNPVSRASRLYRLPAFRAASGSALRPGGEPLTRRGLALCGVPFPADEASPPAALDIGCGAGSTAALLASLGFRVTGVDPSPDLLAEAAGAVAVWPPSTPPPRFLPGRAEHLPLDDASQDLAVCECVLSLVSDAGAALAEAARVLKPGGALLLADVYDRLGGWSDRSGAGRSCLAGARTAPALRALLDRHGFAIRAEEDHSRALAELAARLVFGGDSLAGLARWLGADCTSSLSGRDLARRFGYILMAAEKAGLCPASRRGK